MTNQQAESWQTDFESLLKTAEAASLRDFTKYYKAESKKAVDIFIKKGGLNNADLLAVFTKDGFQKGYENLYESIGMRFANWYAKNYQKYTTKATNIEQQQEPWRAYFRSYGMQVAAERVVLVQGTAKGNLITVLRKLLNDPVFMAEGEIVKAKMLLRQYENYSLFQARRLVRTEATRIANVATLRSAQDMFPGEQMQKIWITSMDGRERDWHGAANGQIVNFNDNFLVGGEYVKSPGFGSSRNVVNCRCSTAPFVNTQTIKSNYDNNKVFKFKSLNHKAENDTYNDYPQSVSNNAKRGIELNEKVNNKCATDVGKQRAQQLAKKEKISVSTIKRMYSYLSRALEYYDPSDTKACGTISYLLWGGKAGLNWSRKKLRELEELDD